MRGPLILILALSGCGAPLPEQTGRNQSQPSDSPFANAANTPGEPPRARAESSALPDAVVISTNEPFWQARVEGDFVTLVGVDQPERRLQVASDDTGAQGRRVIARDESGQIEVTVRDTPCQDSMSGAQFPFSGSIAIDGHGGAEGCARAAGTPPPPVPGEAPAGETGAAMIPAPFLGRWAPDAAACRNPASSIEGLTIEPRSLRYHESLGVPSRVEADGARQISVTSHYDGEGEQWTATQTLRLSASGDRLSVVTDGDSFERIRCP